LAALLIVCNPALPQNKNRSCNKPPRLVSQPQFSKADAERLKISTLRGRVAITINEEGDVTEERVITATPKEASQLLLDAVKKAKFSSRTGCGVLKTEVFFDINPN
jgi:outer membrane biosynthesis protein TonB